MENGNIKISVIVPVYNTERYLSKCLDSILRQDFSDYEVLCVNDASPDNAASILQSYADRYSQIRVFTNIGNKGLSAARNTGLENARGEYIWFVDSDDLIAENSLQELYRLAEERGTDILYFGMTRINEEDGDCRNLSLKEEVYNGSEMMCSGREFFCRIAADQGIRPTAWMQFIRRKFLTEQKIGFYEGILHEDQLFWFLCSMSAKKVSNINKAYYLYRQRSGSIMAIKDYKRGESMFVILLKIITYWNSHSFTESEDKVIGMYVESLYSTYQYYSCFGKETEILSVGGYKERQLYKMLTEKRECRYVSLSKEQINELSRKRHVIVFGCGRAAYDVVSILTENNIAIDGIMVSSMEGNPEWFYGVKVHTIDSFNYEMGKMNMEDTAVVIGVTRRHGLGIAEKLESLGYKNIMIPENIKRTDDHAGDGNYTHT